MGWLRKKGRQLDKRIRKIFGKNAWLKVAALIGGGYIFNAYDIWKHYIDIGLDKIKKISKPNKMEYINYTPKSI